MPKRAHKRKLTLVLTHESGLEYTRDEWIIDLRHTTTCEKEFIERGDGYIMSVIIEKVDE